MKKRRIKWPYGNSDFAAFEVESAAGLLVAHRNHPLVRSGERLCQGWDLWLDGKFAGALSSRTLKDLATLPREELLRVTRPAQGVKRIKLGLTLGSLTLELIDARRGERTRGEYLDSLVLADPPPSS